MKNFLEAKPGELREEDMFDTSPENEHEYPPKLTEPSPEEKRMLAEVEANPPANPFPED